ISSCSTRQLKMGLPAAEMRPLLLGKSHYSHRFGHTKHSIFYSFSLCSHCRGDSARKTSESQCEIGRVLSFPNRIEGQGREKDCRHDFLGIQTAQDGVKQCAFPILVNS